MPSRPAGNPWLSIWTSPRLTLAEIVRTNPSYRFFLFCFIYGFVSLLQGAQQAALGTEVSAAPILLIAAVLGFFLGFIAISIATILLKWTGKWIGGKGTYREIRAAVAWSNVPVAVDLILWLALAAVFGQLIFTQDFARVLLFQTSEGSLLYFPEPGFLIAIGVIRLVLNVWSIVIFLGGLSQVQGFSVFKAILNALFSIVVVIAVVWIASMIAWWIQGLMQR